VTAPAGAALAGGGVLQGKIALVTAAASGMGRAGALLFAAQGAHVIAADVNGPGCEDVVAEVVRAGGSAEAHAVDLGDRAALDAFLTKVETAHEVIDVLWNHVGITGPTRLDFGAAAWDECMRVNVWVPTAVTQRLVPLLRRSGSASIVFTASQAGIAGTAALPVYSASKGAVIQFMKSVALLLAPDGIRANAICPGLTNTAGMRAAFQDGLIEETLAAFAKSVPLGRVAEPEDVATVALFLASDASRYMTGTVLPVDGGVTVG
jgi:3-oxoacyl-[acyl-carrier protein] reductase